MHTFINTRNRGILFFGPAVLLPVLFLSISSVAAGQHNFPSARSAALGNIQSTADLNDPCFFNPAELGPLNSFAVGIGHSLPYFVQELGISALSFHFTSLNGGFQLAASSTGITGYRIITSEASYGMVLSERLSAGISFTYVNTTSQNEWNYLWCVGPGVGLSYNLSSVTKIGAVVKNPVTTGNFPEYGPIYPFVLATGISHEIYTGTTAFYEFSYTDDLNIQNKFAIEINTIELAAFRIGFHSHPATFSFGSGIHYGSAQIDLAFCWSAITGICPSIMLSYQPDK